MRLPSHTSPQQKYKNACVFKLTLKKCEKKDSRG